MRRLSPNFVVTLAAIFAVAAACWGTMFAVAMGDSTALPGARELGRIHWRNDFDRALADSKSQNKPLLMLVKERATNSTSIGYGDIVLSHPLIVEAAEDLFVPTVLEPAATTHLAPGMPGAILRDGADYTLLGAVHAMVTSLENSHHEVPTYLKLLLQEEQSRGRASQRAVFAMGCFWSGEASLGAIDGVTRTRPGFAGNQEVVELEFDPNIVSLDQIAKMGKSCSGLEVMRDQPKSIRTDEQPKFYLAQTSLKFLPMTAAQAARVNAAVHEHQDFSAFLSPRQRSMYRAIEQNPHAPWKNVVDSPDFSGTWYTAQKTMLASGVNAP